MGKKHRDEQNGATHRFRQPEAGVLTRHCWVANAGDDLEAIKAYFGQWGPCEVRFYLKCHQNASNNHHFCR